jgi:hypothetical protein
MRDLLRRMNRAAIIELAGLLYEDVRTVTPAK